MLTAGVDIIEIHRIEKALARHGERFLHRIYTPTEIAHARGRVVELAARFAAKEAVSKALGTGMRGIGWREIEIVADHRGKPLVVLHGRAAQRAKYLGLQSFAISLSHSREQAIAVVVAI